MSWVSTAFDGHKFSASMGYGGKKKERAKAWAKTEGEVIASGGKAGSTPARPLSSRDLECQALARKYHEARRRSA